MKTVVLTSSSAKSSTTRDDRSETQDSCYFPGCRKDANCHCEICLASINATLDLMPMSIQQSSLTKLSVSKSTVERTPISFNASIMSTPTKGNRRIPASPPLKSTAKSNILEKTIKKRKKSWVIGFDIWSVLVVLSMTFAVDSGLSYVISRLFQPMLSVDIVRKIGEESWVGNDLNEKLGLLQKNLGEVVNGEISNCSSVDSSWELNQDGLLLSSHCTFYKSWAEEVSIWGWPLQTSGLLATGFSSRSLTILSGRVTEWPNGKAGFSIRKVNSSWLLGKLRASAVQLDRNTWVLEYRRNTLLENPRIFSAVLEFLKFRTSRVVGEMKQLFFLLPVSDHKYSDHVEDRFTCPT